MKFKLFGYEFTVEQAVKVFEPENTVDANAWFNEKIKEQEKSKKPKGGFTSKPWSGEDLEKLIKMYERGLSAVGIARALGRTRSAITSKLWKLKKNGTIS